MSSTSKDRPSSPPRPTTAKCQEELYLVVVEDLRKFLGQVLDDLSKMCKTAMETPHPSSLEAVEAIQLMSDNVEATRESLDSPTASIEQMKEVKETVRKKLLGLKETTAVERQEESYLAIVENLRKFLGQVLDDLSEMRKTAMETHHPSSRGAVEAIQLMYDNIMATKKGMDLSPTASVELMKEVEKIIRERLLKLKDDIEEMFFPL